MTRTRQTATELDGDIDRLLRDPSLPIPAGEGELTATALLLRDALPRLHPRFSFEELLAARLAAAGRPATAVAPAPVPIRPGVRIDTQVATPIMEAVEEAVERRRRTLRAGGAIASGVSLALPIAGAALVVWRRTRSSGGLS
jgi:hypothetical protein